ncbi:MAG: UPF0280 family protein [Rhizobiaceae bacterium]|nr:UPF0280 family protein [Rhizobiaceae bacterium]
MTPQATILPCGKRLHLQHGPIDLIISVDRNHNKAFKAAIDRFETVLEELASELPTLRSPLNASTIRPEGEIANLMHDACLPYARDQFVTRMAAVAGAVADTILLTMRNAAKFQKAYVNNGGDIALYLEDGQKFVTSVQSHQGFELGRIDIRAGDGISGIATSGRHGRSHSLGIADSVTVLAETAAQADVAATLIANAVDIPNHPLVMRKPAAELSPDSDLGAKLVVIGCEELSPQDQNLAIENGKAKAEVLLQQGLIKAAALFFQDAHRIIGQNNLKIHERMVQYA